MPSEGLRFDREDPTGTRSYEDRQAVEMRKIVKRCIDRATREILKEGASPQLIDRVLVTETDTAEKDMLEVSQRFIRSAEEMAIKRSQTFIERRTRDRVGIVIGAVGLPKEMKESVRNNVELDVQSVSVDIRKDLSRIISEGIAAGYSLDKIKAAVQDQTLELPNRAEMIARTTIMKTFNETAKNRYVQARADTMSILPTPDNRLCEKCRIAAMTPSGELKKYKPDKVPFLPIHPNCRCGLIPNYEDSDEILLSSPETIKEAGNVRMECECR